MVGMPHMITKGPELSVMDHHYSSAQPVAERITILNYLEARQRDGVTPLNPVSGEQTLASLNLNGRPGLPLTGPLREAAFDTDWFGYAAGVAQNPAAAAPTGWWQSWQGNAEGICREALIRAIRLSLGLSQRAVGAGPATVGQVVFANPINISFRWSCGAPTFEAYVEWDTGPTGRYVVVTFSTPPVPQPIWLDFRAPAIGAQGYARNPTDPKNTQAPVGTKGVWLVAHETTFRRIAARPIAAPVAGVLNLAPPASWLSGSNGVGFSPIVAVDIPEQPGGVATPPLTW